MAQRFDPKRVVFLSAAGVNVLVLSVGSPLGQSVVKSLQSSTIAVNVHVADINHFAAGFYFPEVAATMLPLVKDSKYAKEISEYIVENKVSAVFPIIAAEHEFFEHNVDMFDSLGVAILACSPETYKLCSDKYESMAHLRKLGIDAPDTALCSSDEAIEEFLKRNTFPVFIKPRYGASSADLFRLESRDQLFALIRAFPPNHFVVQEFLGDRRDFTAGVFISPDLSYSSAMLIERELKFGLSYRGEVFENEDFSRYCVRVAEAFSSTYSVNVQFKVKDNMPFAYEINPRLSSTSSVRAHFGFNEPEMMLRYGLGLGREQPVGKRTGLFTRFWQEHYLDDE